MTKIIILVILVLLLVPGVLAHNMPFLSFKPLIVSPGQNVTISGDGLKTSGNYLIYLKSQNKIIMLGRGYVAEGDDSFDATFPIPKNMIGSMYSVEIKSVNNPRFEFYAPLQLAVQPYSVVRSSSQFVNITYPIPSNEIPWIIAFILVSLILGIKLVLKKTH